MSLYYIGERRGFHTPILADGFGIMQRFFPRSPHLILLILFGGCGPTAIPTASSGPAKPYAGKSLKIAVADPALATEIRGRAQAWANRTDAKVTVVGDKPPGDISDADIAIVTQSGITGPASRGELVPVPESLSANGKAFRWDTLFVPYQTSLVQWGSQLVAVPIAGDGLVCIYRADCFGDPAAAKAFRNRYQRDLVAPRTWEDIAEIAASFNKPGQPSLAPLPADPAGALALFHQMAACYDRSPIGTGNKEEGGAARALSFHLDIAADKFLPRLNAPAFAAAYSWFHNTAPYRPATAGDPLAAIGTGSAVVAILTLREVARLPRDPKTGAISDVFGIAPVPGTRTFFNAENQPQQAVGGRNAIPYLGDNGAYAIVYKSSANAAAAWDFLTDLTGPDGSAGTVGESQLGAGPLREGHVTGPTGTAIWQSYGFDEARTKDLGGAMLAFTNSIVANPAPPLRTPDAAQVYAILDAQLRRAASGQATGPEAAAAASAAWAEHDRMQDSAQLKRWRRQATGLD